GDGHLEAQVGGRLVRRGGERQADGGESRQERRGEGRGAMQHGCDPREEAGDDEVHSIGEPGVSTADGGRRFREVLTCRAPMKRTRCERMRRRRSPAHKARRDRWARCVAWGGWRCWRW